MSETTEETNGEESGLTPEQEAMPVGAPFPSIITTDPSTVPNPNRTMEEQGDEMAPVIVGPPGYGSPDPLSATGRLIPLAEHPQAEEIAETTYGEGYTANLTAAETLAPSPGPGTGEDAEAAEGGTDYSSQLKDDLLTEAESRGLDVSSSNTKAEIIAALEADDAENA